MIDLQDQVKRAAKSLHDNPLDNEEAIGDFLLNLGRLLAAKLLLQYEEES